MGTRWEFGILGPLEVTRDGAVVAIPAAKQRALLASLLVDANRTVSVEQLVARLWAADPPQGARVTLQNYVMRLRKALGDDGTLISTRPTGYQITVDSGMLDFDRFDELTSHARQLIAHGDAERASALLRQALELWRGDALCDIESDVLQQEVVTGLAERRLAGIEARIEADLLLGRHAEVTTELRGLTSRHPLRERFWAQLLLALYRSGRQAEALETYRTVSTVLADELGVDPNPNLQVLHQRILSADPALTPTAAPASSPPTVPRQLPAAPRWFIGRDKELAQLDETTGQTATVVISTIAGMGGIGKTSLAVHWAHQNLDRFPDGQLYVNLRGFDGSGDAVPATAALRGFLDALGVDGAVIPADLGSLVGLYRSVMADRRMLVVLDNASNSDQVSPLLPASAHCTVLVTSRHRLSGLITTHGAQPLTLQALDHREARELLAQRVGREKLIAEPDATDALLEYSAGLPLALSILAARAAAHPDFHLAALATELAEASARLDALDAGEVTANLRTAFSASYTALDPAAAKVFCLLGLATGPDVGTSAVASLVGLPSGRAVAALRALETAHLVQQHTPGRYRMHDLVRLYAAERAYEDVPERERTPAVARLIEFYAHSAHAGERLLDPFRTPIELSPPSPGCSPRPPTDVVAALDWFTTEHACLLAVLKHCVAEGDHRATWQLAWSLGTFHWRRGLVVDNRDTWQSALAAVTELGHTQGQVEAHRRLGLACARIDGDTAAFDHLWRSLELAEKTGDVLGEAHTHHSLAWVWARRGDDLHALAHAESALKLLRETENPVWEAQSLNVVGWYQARAGWPERGLGYCRAALELSRRHGDREAQADALDSLGYIAYQLGQHTEAVDYYRAALSLFEALGHTYEQANTLESLGRAHHALGDTTDAHQTWRQALQLYEAQHRSVDAYRVRDRLGADQKH